MLVSNLRAQSNSGCPLELRSVNLAPAHSLGTFPLRYDFSRNLERVLRVRYKNVSGKEIVSGHLSVSISFYEPGPVYDKITYSELDLALTSRVGTGKENTISQKVLTSGVPPRAWVREVTYSDGSQWTSNDPVQCQYSQHSVQATSGPLVK
jgi:hypothetical protein